MNFTATKFPSPRVSTAFRITENVPLLRGGISKSVKYLPMTSGTLATPYVHALHLGTYFTRHCLPSLHEVIMPKPDDNLAETVDE